MDVVALRGGRRCRLVAVALISLMASGCGGCGSDDAAADKSGSTGKSSSAKSKTRKKPDYEIGGLGVMPGSDAARHVKPGHWSTATHEVTANNFDAVCDFRAEMRENGQPVDWPGTPYRLHTSQPAQLPKGKTRYLQTLFFVPERSQDGLSSPNAPNSYKEYYNQGKTVIVRDRNSDEYRRTSRRLQLSSSLRQRSGGTIQEQQPALTVMKPHEYQFVVLAPKSVGYNTWRRLSSLQPPNPEIDKFDDFDESDEKNPGRDIHYHLVIPPIAKNRPPPLSSHPLTWTSTAYVLWDELDPLYLSAAQQQAMLDWLHWGGQLIVSGPKSLDLLRGSFLSPYLPATSEQAVDMEPGDLQPLSDFFQSIDAEPALRVAKPWAGVKLALHDDAQMIRGTGDLVAERRVGRGRVVVTAFRLRERELFAWSKFDSFLNTVLLRREPRNLRPQDVSWRSGQSRWDPSPISDVRYFSRDFKPGKKTSALSMAGWNDRSPASNAARDSLRSAAGIEIPEASFIVCVMAVYLIVLVPMNWGVFRLLGRVELAWIAAPIITIVFTVAVVKLAQLDIGFARSQTEYCIVEVQSDYSRAHVTRYTALYASLSTSYEFEFDNDSALIGPFPSGEAVGRQRYEMTLRRESNVSAEGFNVSSNSTGIVHSEQMFDLGGAIQLVGSPGTERVTNGSTLSLAGAVVIQRTAANRLKAAWIGELAAGEDALLKFVATKQADALKRHVRQSQAFVSSSDSPDMLLDRMLGLAHNHRPLKPGESRLIAWTKEEVPGMQVSPVASQVRRATMVVVHLNYALDRGLPQLDKVE
jgi:hypothetical protein